MDFENFHPDQVENYRHAHESGTEWNLRKKFLLAHYQRLPADRLSCLASCFINVECYGCKYPAGVMMELKELSMDIMPDIEEHRTRIQSQRDMKFVRASDNTGKAAKRESKQEGPLLKQEARPLSGVPALADRLGPELRRRKNRKKGENAIELIQMVVVDKCKMAVDYIIDTGQKGDFECSVCINRITVAKASATKKKVAKLRAAEAAVGILRVGGKAEEPNKGKGKASGKAGMVGHPSSAVSWDSFVIREPLNCSTPLGILTTSAKFNDLSLEHDCRQTINGNYECRLAIGGEEVAVEEAIGKKDAIKEAASAALNELRSRCWTMQIRQPVNEDEDGVSREEVQGKIKHNALPNSNIGGKLMQKMGWTGGGLGKEGNEGITEPVTADSQIRRQGLGLDAGMTQGFKEKIKQMLNDYATSGREEDLFFSSDFSSDERKFIHSEARKFNLKTKSYGSGDERYIVVSPSMNKEALMHHIQSKGGCTGKYMLIPPASKDLKI